MTDKGKELAKTIIKLEKDCPDIDRILDRPAIIDTGREPKTLCRIPVDIDFMAKDGNTEYEVTGHFDPHADGALLDTIVRRLGYRYGQDQR